MTDPQTIDAKRKLARNLLWKKGDLSWKLDPLQQEMRKKFYEGNNKINVWLMSRRLGKSHTLCTLAIETCIKQKNAIVKYLAMTSKQAKELSDYIIISIVEDAPPEVKPEFSVRDSCWKFPNGAKIQFAGADNNGAEKLRGAACHLAIVDEAGFCDQLTYSVRTILLPTLLTTNGKLILSSTPPTQGDHDFIEFIQKAEDDKSLIKKTIYDCPRYTKEFIQAEIVDQYPGGLKNRDFRREYLVEMTRSEDRNVIPEFTEELQSKIIKDWTRPGFYDCYVAADWGITDLTGILFAYYDFKSAKVIIEDELIMNGARMNTSILAQAIKDKERTLWSDPISAEPKQVYMRVGDNNLHIIQDLSLIHQLNFVPTEKQNKEGYLNTLRVMLQDEKIIIHPRCKNLINHIKYAEWTPNSKTFRRSSTYGHYDLVDCLTYLIRNMVYSKNPYPRGSFDLGVQHRSPSYKEPLSVSHQTIKNLFHKPNRR